ncbi:MAG: pyridoxal-phosphate dependent enzyme [Chloroflexota bacterium]
MNIFCTNCKRPYPEEGAPYKCPKCGGLFDAGPIIFDPDQVSKADKSIWRYRHTFSGIPESADVVSLGEGNTPLIWTGVFGRQIAFKCEFLNPTGSFKDRGTTVITTFLKSRGITNAVEDSSGNAGASFAAYSAKAGIQAGIYIPASASGPKLNQIAAYGAQIFPVNGSRSDVTNALENAVFSKGITYGSHAYQAVNIAGYATAAYEIYQQLGSEPGSVIVPAGQGGLFLGIFRGFEALKNAGLIRKIPHMVGVQARACSPLWILSTAGTSAMGFIVEGKTLAEGIKVKQPVRAGTLLEIVDHDAGEFVVVDEIDILRGRDELACKGLYVEPTSAVIWAAIEQSISRLPEPVVGILTGSGMKYSK